MWKRIKTEGSSEMATFQGYCDNCGCKTKTTMAFATAEAPSPEAGNATHSDPFECIVNLKNRVRLLKKNQVREI